MEVKARRGSSSSWRPPAAAWPSSNRCATRTLPSASSRRGSRCGRELAVAEAETARLRARGLAASPRAPIRVADPSGGEPRSTSGKLLSRLSRCAAGACARSRWPTNSACPSSASQMTRAPGAFAGYLTEIGRRTRTSCRWAAPPRHPGGRKRRYVTACPLVAGGAPRAGHTHGRSGPSARQMSDVLHSAAGMVDEAHGTPRRCRQRDGRHRFCRELTQRAADRTA